MGGGADSPAGTDGNGMAALADALRGIDGDGDTEPLLLGDGARAWVPVPVALGTATAAAESVALTVDAAVPASLGEEGTDAMAAVALAVQPTSERLTEAVGDGTTGSLGMLLLVVGMPLPVPVLELLPVEEATAAAVLLDVCEAAAVPVSEAVDDTVSDAVAAAVPLGVCEAAAVPVDDAVDDTVSDAVAAAVPLDVCEAAAVAAAVPVSDAVDDTEDNAIAAAVPLPVLLPVHVTDSVAAGVPLPVPMLLPVPLMLPVLLPLLVPLSLGGGLLVAVSVPLLDAVLDDVALRVAVCVALTVVLLVPVRVALDERDVDGVGSTHVTPTVSSWVKITAPHGSPNTALDAVMLHVLLPRHALVTTAREVAAWHHGDSAQPAAAHDESRARISYSWTG